MTYLRFMIIKGIRFIVFITLIFFYVKYTVFPPHPTQWTDISIIISMLVLISSVAFALLGVIGYWIGDKEFEDAGMGRSGLIIASLGLIIFLYLIIGYLQ